VAGMTSANGCHFDGHAEVAWKKLKFVTYCFFNLYFVLHTTINCTAVSTQRSYVCVNLVMLRQHHRALWQKHGIVTQHDGQTLWQKRKTLPCHIYDLVLLSIFFAETFYSLIRNILKLSVIYSF